MEDGNTISLPPSSPTSAPLPPEPVTGRIFKVIDGLLELAEVTVRVAESNDDRVIVDMDPRPEGYPPSSAWVDAAIRGAAQAVGELRRLSPSDARRLTVTITQISGTGSDTRPAAVLCAAGLAVWRVVAGAEPDIRWGRDLHLVYSLASKDQLRLA